MLFESKDELISIIYAKSMELSIVDIRNKKQGLKRLVIDAKMPTKILFYFSLGIGGHKYVDPLI